METEKQDYTGSANDHKTFEYLSETENLLVIESTTASIIEILSSQSQTSQPTSDSSISDDELTSQLIEDSFVSYQSTELMDKSSTSQSSASAGEFTDAFTTSFEISSVNPTEVPSQGMFSEIKIFKNSKF